MGAPYVNTKSTCEAVERLAVSRSSGEVVTVEGVDAGAGTGDRTAMIADRHRGCPAGPWW